MTCLVISTNLSKNICLIIKSLFAHKWDEHNHLVWEKKTKGSNWTLKPHYFEPSWKHPKPPKWTKLLRLKKMQKISTRDGDFSMHHCHFLLVNPFLPLLLGTWSSLQQGGWEKTRKKTKRQRKKKKEIPFNNLATSLMVFFF